MRVIAGSARGTKLFSVPGETTRPILDRVKVALFDKLGKKIGDATFLDLFSGSGSIAIEALSRGAKHATMLDLEEEAIKTIKKNLELTSLKSKAEVRHTDAFRYLRHTQKSFDLIYIAPPQYQGIWLETLKVVAELPDLLNKDGSIIVQIDPKEYELLSLRSLVEVKQQHYGNTLLIYLKRV
jgi:16S rRNA (guanine(966)-N(2))-methyltransferase RsmD